MYKRQYVFARPNAMKDHDFTDDVAITYASNKAEAIEKFSKYYAQIKRSEVQEVFYNIDDIAILTDY